MFHKILVLHFATQNADTHGALPNCLTKKHFSIRPWVHFGTFCLQNVRKMLQLIFDPCFAFYANHGNVTTIVRRTHGHCFKFTPL